MTLSTLKTRSLSFLAVLNVVWNIVFGLFSYLRLAFQLFWEEYGEEIQVGLVRFFFLTVDFSGEVYFFGRKARRSFDQWLERKLDSAFFQLVEVQ